MTYKRILLFLMILSAGLAIGGAVKSEMLDNPPEITDISVKGVDDTTEIQINSNAIISYTIYRPEDPYRVIVEIQGVELGKFKDRIAVDDAGVTEIIPSMIEGRAKAARLEIVLSVPAEIKPVQKEKTLILSFYNPEAKETDLASDEEAMPSALEEEVKKIASVIEDIKITSDDANVKVLMTGDGEMQPKVFEVNERKLVLDIPGVTTAIDSLDSYEPPVVGMRIGNLTDKTRIVFDLAGPAEYNLSAEGNEVTVSFKKPEVTAAETAAAPAAETAVIKEPSAQTVKPFATKDYVGENISLDFQDADLLHIFRLLADVSGYNIIVSPGVKGKFSMKLNDVPWDQALDIVLRNYGLSKTVDGNIIRVAPTDVIAEEEEAIARAKDATLKSGDLETKVYPINYADVKTIETVIKDAKIMTNRGFISTDTRTSTLIIKDVSSMHKEIERLIKSLDQPTPQVNIEAKIVEVTTKLTKELGIQWGVLWRPADSRMRIGGPSLPGGSGFNSANPLMVNMPAAAGSGTGGAIGLGYISAANTFTLDMQLSAMETTGKGKIISNPRITTSDNKQATIQQGKSIPYQTVSADGTKTEFIDANIELTVTPHITPDKTIVMEIQAKKNEANFSESIGGVPSIDKKEAKTQVLINDGDTLVIGGIFKTSHETTRGAVPGLSKIPILGMLFKRDQTIDSTNELLIFITPRIVK